ncbi:MAG: cyclic nucleotide-binding domain-containing protein [Candidatus Hydrogenedentes bacterium]|nr:cyclic nucleotide-binding domain-containing protein [Candidatus Hydrogenedentota bacterium]
MSPDNRFQTLAQKVGLFRGLSPDDVEKIFSKGMTMAVERGNTIFFKGVTGNQMFVVLGGKVALFDGKKHIASLGPGDMFGEMALINNEPRSAAAIAAETAQLFVLDETTFQKLMTKTVAIRILLNIIGTLSHRLRDANAKISSLQAT